MAAGGGTAPTHVGDVEEDASQLLFPKGLLLSRDLFNVCVRVVFTGFVCHVVSLEPRLCKVKLNPSCLTEGNENVYTKHPNEKQKCISTN